MATTICSSEGCRHAATHAPQLNIPAQGWAIDLHQPIYLLVNIPLCKEHAAVFGDTFKWSENEKLKAAIEAASRGKAPPDFDRAFHSTVRLDSEMYRKFAMIQQDQP